MMFFLAATTAIVHLIELQLIMLANGDSIFVAYSEPNFAGSSTYCKAENDGCNVSEIISIQMTAGTCGQILDFKTGTLLGIEENIADTDFYFNGKLSTCPTHSSRAECPSGTFVKQIEWDTSFNLTKGIKLSCYKPESNSSSEAVIVSSHPESSFSDSEKIFCPSFEEITITANSSMDADVALKIAEDCKEPANKTILDNKLECQSSEALSGIAFLIETKTNYIKSSSLICSEVPNIATSCKAVDGDQLVPYSKSGDEVLQFVKKVGVGLKSELSESEKIEYDFYYPFNLSIGFPLSSNFKDNVGKSDATGYDWGSAPKSTWQNEETVTIEVEKSSCQTEFFEIVGECSYMNVRPYHLKRVDHCLKGSITTIERIPHNVRKRSYRSQIPDVVNNIISG